MNRDSKSGLRSLFEDKSSYVIGFLGVISGLIVMYLAQGLQINDLDRRIGKIEDKYSTLDDLQEKASSKLDIFKEELTASTLSLQSIKESKLHPLEKNLSALQERYEAIKGINNVDAKNLKLFLEYQKTNLPDLISRLDSLNDKHVLDLTTISEIHTKNYDLWETADSDCFIIAFFDLNEDQKSMTRVLGLTSKKAKNPEEGRKVSASTTIGKSPAHTKRRELMMFVKKGELWRIATEFKEQKDPGIKIVEPENLNHATRLKNIRGMCIRLGEYNPSSLTHYPDF